jgi:hypothetical protein
MMLKCSGVGAYDFGEPAVALIKLRRDGRLGPHDRSVLEKRAGVDFLDRLRRVKLAADEVPVHIIALGADEYYGANRNGDGFDEPTCRAQHPTFQKYGRFYRNHLNKDQSRSYGVFHDTAYNDAMKRVELLAGLNGSEKAARVNGGLVADKELELLERGEDIPTSMACSKAGTLIRTHAGFKPIELIEHGDLVVTHLGRLRPVGHTSRRMTDEIVKIKLRSYGRQMLEFTPNHEFFVARWEDVPKASHFGTFPSKHFRRKYRDRFHEVASWRPCSELKAGDYLLMPIIREKELPADLACNAARLLGYYAAEGSLIDNTSKGICLTCNAADIVVSEVYHLVAKGITICQRPKENSTEAVSIEVYDRDLFDAASAFGRGVRNKKVPAMVYAATSEIRTHFLGAWFNGDGWQDKKGLHWSTCSRTLSLDLQQLLAGLNIPASVHRIDHTSDLPGGVPRGGDGIEYVVTISNAYSGIFAGKSKAVTWETGEHIGLTFVTGNYLAVPIGSVERVREECEVYNFAVAEDETYTAFGLATHNCKVAHDVCSGCGHQARTRAEYCHGAMCKYGGLKDNIGRTFDDGHLLHALNPDAVWFDDSHVHKPADRIAWSLGRLQKAASAGTRLVGLGGAALAEEIGLTAPDEVLDDHLPPWVARHRKLARALAEVERRVEAEGSRAVDRAFHPGVQGRIPIPADVDTPGRLGQMLGALAAEKVAMPLRDFLVLVAGDEKRAEEAYAAVAAQLPGVYGRLVASPTFDIQVRDSLYTVPESCPPLALRTWATKHAAAHGLAPEHVSARIETHALRDLPVSRPRGRDEVMLKEAADYGGAERLARQYALYKLALAAALRAEDEQALPALETLLVRQNYAA